MKKIATSALLLLASSMAFAGNDSALSLPGYFGSINNNTDYVVECSQLIGGYCANNPMPTNGYLQMLPDPGSTQIRGHIMAFDKNVPGKYADNLIFSYSEQKDGTWKFQTESLSKIVDIRMVSGDTIVLSKAAAK